MQKYSFKGEFRSYQAEVLSRAEVGLRDGKIHIVAAPGSGKTILGLELISRLGVPALILSPTVTIKQQWGERFYENFVNEEEYKKVFSFDLRNLKEFTSVTYQALHAASTKGTVLKEEIAEMDETDEVLDEIQLQSEIIDFTGFDLIGAIKAANIGVVCLDEAHHLRSEWQKALESVLKKLSVKVIALTATPPYDSNPTQWDRYISLCGEIDEEIFVPELVFKNTLCPHQDFIYFNYPTAEEEAILKEYKTKLLENDTLEIEDAETWNGTGKIEKAKTDIKAIKSTLKTKAKIKEKADKILLSSIGKLSGIEKIVESEVSALGVNLRMLILTDFIRKEMLPIIGTEEPIGQMGTVPIFETVRRLELNTKIALLSGTLVILPNEILEDISTISKASEIGFSSKEIVGVDYSIVTFSGTNKNKVMILTEAFSKGLINVLIGTKSLLGEGWDSPCINSLILASFVGSFMLSNQMRGRAIRVDKMAPDKVSNIWHLVTLEPPSLIKSTEKMYGADFETISRRFDCFVAPSYDGTVIESGMDRLICLKPPFDENGVKKINATMLQLASNRTATKATWFSPASVTSAASRAQVSSAVSSESMLSAAMMKFNKLYALIASLILFVIAIISIILLTTTGQILNIIGALGLFTFLGIAPKILKKAWRRHRFTSPEKCIFAVSKCIFMSMRKLGFIETKDAHIKIQSNDNKVSCVLLDASAREKEIFAKAMTELLSPIDNPRYLIVKSNTGLFRKKFDYTQSYACPSILATNKDTTSILKGYLARYIDEYELIYTKSESGKKVLENCVQKSYLTTSKNKVESKRILL
ncbi:MAG: DEAD/DEAH box helicase family protein [Ruminococcaceae bacterium]|nr:DEAD/DEAH box helicase family protein [Oscillospiraceae bacterium]